MKLVVALSLLAATAAPAAHADAPCKPQKVTFPAEASLDDLATLVTAATCKPVVFDLQRLAVRLKIVGAKEMTGEPVARLFADSLAAVGMSVNITDSSIVVTGDCGATAAAGLADEEIARQVQAGVIEVDATHKKITKELVARIVATPMLVTKGVRLVPAVKDGKVNGFKLYAIRPTSVVARLGFLNGDTVVAVNGFALDTGDKAIEVFEKLRTATAIQVDLVRRGQPLKLAIQVE